MFSLGVHRGVWKGEGGRGAAADLIGFDSGEFTYGAQLAISKSVHNNTSLFGSVIGEDPRLEAPAPRGARFSAAKIKIPIPSM
jgi:hypothetical protein